MRGLKSQRWQRLAELARSNVRMEEQSLMRANTAVQHAEAKHRLLSDHVETLAVPSRGRSTTARSLLVEQQFKQRLAAAIAEQYLQVQACRTDAANARRAWIQARRRVQSFEQLAEREIDQREEAQLAAERRELDSAGVIAYQRAHPMD